MTEYKFLIERHDGKEVDVCDTRHDAVGRRAIYHDCNDYDIISVTPLGAMNTDPSVPDYDGRVAGRGW